jgi:hypothetical protein
VGCGGSFSISSRRSSRHRPSGRRLLRGACARRTALCWQQQRGWRVEVGAAQQQLLLEVGREVEGAGKVRGCGCTWRRVGVCVEWHSIRSCTGAGKRKKNGGASVSNPPPPPPRCVFYTVCTSRKQKLNKNKRNKTDSHTVSFRFRFCSACHRRLGQQERPDIYSNQPPNLFGDAFARYFIRVVRKTAFFVHV